MHLLLMLIFIFLAPGQEDSVARGREFYMTGAAGEPVMAQMGDPPTSVPAAVLPCSGCHGRDGHGRVEGGLIPPDITWSTLSLPYELQTRSGRRRPEYDQASLLKVILTGIDSGGNRLNPTMPRYQLSPQLTEDLLAWLQVMETQQDPGLSDREIRLGVLISETADGKSSPTMQAIAAYGADLKQQGGIYGRNLVLLPLVLPPGPDDRAAEIRRFLKEESPFALIAAEVSGISAETASFVSASQIPLLASSCSDPPDFQNGIYYLFAGESDQARVLASYSSKEFGQDRAMILVPPGREKIAAAIVDQFSSMGWLTTPTLEIVKPDQNLAILASRLARRGGRYLFYLGSLGPDENLFFQQIAQSGWKPMVLAPAALASQFLVSMDHQFENLLLAFPFEPGLQGRDSVQEYQRIASAHQLPLKAGPSQLAAFSVMKVLHRALVLGGRDLSRYKLQQSLEKIYGLQFGYGPPVSFSANRHQGSAGAFVVAFKNGIPTPVKGLVVPSQ